MYTFVVCIALAVFLVWYPNVILNLRCCKRICKEFRDNDNYSYDVDEIYDYYSPFSYKSWFGFRHYVYPYKYDVTDFKGYEGIATLLRMGRK